MQMGATITSVRPYLRGLQPDSGQVLRTGKETQGGDGCPWAKKRPVNNGSKLGNEETS